MSSEYRKMLHRRAAMIWQLAQTVNDARARNVLEAAAKEIEALDDEGAQLLFDEPSAAQVS